jgi:hypothetical protein
MHVQLKHAGAALLLAVGGTIFSATGCANDDSSLFIAGCLAVPRDTCTAVASVMPTFQLGGVIAGSLGGQYSCFAQVENQLVPTGSSMTLKTETGRVVLQSADINILDASGNTYVRTSVAPGKAQFSVPITGFVNVGDGTDPGLGVSEIPFLDSDTVKDLGVKAAKSGDQLVQVQVLLHGQTLGGLDIQTQKYFLYPVTVTAGSECIVPPGDPCVGGTDKPDTDCLIGQDEPKGGVDCRLLDPCTFLICPGGMLANATCPPAGQLGDGSCCM